MKLYIPLSLFFIIYFISGCTDQGEKETNINKTMAVTENLPIILVDKEHLQTNLGGNQFYQISPSPGLILDATDYKLEIPNELGLDRPNTIQVIAGKEQNYTVKWQTEITRYSLNRDTLIPYTGSKSFKGFERGQQIVIAIGYQNKQNQFYVFWAGIVEVK